MAMRGEIRAIVTAPISKSAWKKEGCDYPGHTELLGSVAGARPVMAFVGREDDGSYLRLALATIHEPLRNVPDMIRANELREILEIVRRDLKISRIAACGLNPHAGEEGLFGNEEEEIRSGIAGLADGPFPADALFSPRMRKKYDLIFAMYHDQGLAPFKALTAGRGVNVTLGLPFIRTSPDHGTALDIAGKNIADPSSMIEAIRLAIDLCN